MGSQGDCILGFHDFPAERGEYQKCRFSSMPTRSKTGTLESSLPQGWGQEWGTCVTGLCFNPMIPIFLGVRAYPEYDTLHPHRRLRR